MSDRLETLRECWTGSQTGAWCDDVRWLIAEVDRLRAALAAAQSAPCLADIDSSVED